jgi:DNA repair exonuclease SbcCD ATPase subunit
MVNNSISEALTVMDDPAVTAKQLVDLARKHIQDHQSRIARQRELIAKYERDDDAARLSEARRVLERMQKQLAQMTAAHVAAEEHLSKLTVDEASVEKVVRDAPM